MLFMMLKDPEERSKAERLFLKYRNLMFNVAMGVLNDGHLAEDAVSQSFERILNHIDKIEEENEEKTSSYMATVCRNVAIDIMNSTTYLNIDEDCAENVEDTINLNNRNPLKIMQGRESFELLIDAVKSLKPIYRDVMMHLCHDMKYSEIAKVLKIKEENVRKRIERGRKILIEMVERSGYYEIKRR